MKTNFLLFVIVLCLSNQASAKIFRLGYTGLPVEGVDFTSSQYNQLQAAANAGDTVQVYGSISGMMVSKRLVFIGFGYNFGINSGLQNKSDKAPSNVQIYFLPGSDSSIAEGLSGNFDIGEINPTQQVVRVSKIIIRRCFGGIFFNVNYGPVTDVRILSCVASDIQQRQNNNFDVINLLVSNSIVSSIILYNAGSSANIVNCNGAPHSSASGALNLSEANCVVKNSIFGFSNADRNPNTIFENNFFSQSQPSTLPAGTNNRWGQSYANIFKRLGGTSNAPGDYYEIAFEENYYLLKAGSPAINGGFNNANAPTDCGIFGGEPAYVYKLSGVPAVPAIYKLEAPTLSAGTNPYNVTISVRSNN